MIAMEADILLWIQNNIRNDVLTPIFKFVTTLGNAGMIWIVLSVGLLIPKKTRRVGVLALVSLSFSALIDNVILKNVVARTRPYDWSVRRRIIHSHPDIPEVPLQRRL